MAPSTSSASRRLPVAEGLLPIDRGHIAGDCIAGLALAALAIPEVIGYARIAGMPIVTGLYTLLVPLALFAVFGSSRHLVVGADSATAAIMAASLAGMAVAGSPRYVALAGLLALLTGGAMFIARLARLGFLADFLSRTVLVGFLTGVGVQVALGQVGGMLGIATSGHDLLHQLGSVVQRLATANPWTLGVSLGVLGVIFALRAINRRIPSALIAVAAAIVASSALSLGAHGVAVLGSVPSGLPSLSLPAVSLSDVSALLATTATLFLVVLAQSAATSRAYATKYGDSLHENVDLVGLGFANIAAGLTGTFVVNGSPTKTEMVDTAGGRSQLAQLTAGAAVLLVLLFLTSLLANLPYAALSAVVFFIGVDLIDLRHFRAIYRLAKAEFVVAGVTAVTVVFIGVEQGIVLAIVLSVIIHLSHSYRPFDYVLVREEDGHWHSRAADSGEQAEPGVAVYRFGASLYYANANRFDAEVRCLVDAASPPLSALVISAEAIGDIDYSAAEMLRCLASDLARRGVKVIVTDIAHNVREELARYNLAELIGADHLHHGLTDAIDDALGREPRLPRKEPAGP